MEISLRYNYYDILEVNPHSPQHEISSAYERAKATYSGENLAIYTMFSEEEARELLKLIEEAYAVLGNKTLRALYDEKIGQKKPQAELSLDHLKNESKANFSLTNKKVPTTKLSYSISEDFEKEISERKNWDGSFLKKVREYKGLSIEKLSEITKINSYYIQAIEEHNNKGLPAAVFVRGYISQITKILNLDEKKVCDSYMKFYKEASENK